MGDWRRAPSPVPPNGGLIWGEVSKPDEVSQSACVLCLKDGTDAPLEKVYMLGGFSFCMTHTQSFLAASQESPQTFVRLYPF